MRRLIAGLIALFALVAPAAGQGCGNSNPNCIVPNRPAGDSTNAAANTRFVTGAGFLQSANNLSDVVSALTSRVNLGAFGTVKIKTFSSSGTYTPSAGMLYALMFCVGSGGAGGGVVGSSTQARGGGGGGSGSLSIALKTAAQVGVSQTVTIGAAATGVSGGNGNAGHDTSIGALCIGKGGGGGNFNDNSTGFGTGASGGVVGTGDITIFGAEGGDGVVETSSPNFVIAVAGAGGNAPLFNGGAKSSVNGGAAATGPGGTAPGGGGGGAAATNSATSAAGGASLAGYAFVIEFNSQ